MDLRPRLVLEYERKQRELASVNERLHFERRDEERNKQKKDVNKENENFYTKIHDPRGLCCTNKTAAYQPDYLRELQPLPWVHGRYGGHIPLKSDRDVGKTSTIAAHEAIWLARATGRVPLSYMSSGPYIPKNQLLDATSDEHTDILQRRAQGGKALFNYSKTHGYTGHYPGAIAYADLYEKCRQAATAKFFKERENQKERDRKLRHQISRNSFSRPTPEELLYSPIMSPDTPLRLQEFTERRSTLERGVPPDESHKTPLSAPLDVRNSCEPDIAFIGNYTGHIPEQWHRFGSTKVDQYRAALDSHFKRQVICRTEKSSGYYTYRTDEEISLLKDGKFGQLGMQPKTDTHNRMPPGANIPDTRKGVVGLTETEIHWRTKRLTNEGEYECQKGPSMNDQTDEVIKNVMNKYMSTCTPNYCLKKFEGFDKETAIYGWLQEHDLIRQVDKVPCPPSEISPLLPRVPVVSCKPQMRMRDYKERHFLRGLSKPMEKYVKKHFYHSKPAEYKIQDYHRKPYIETTFDNERYPYLDNKTYNHIDPPSYNERNYFFLNRTAKDIPEVTYTLEQEKLSGKKLQPKYYDQAKEIYLGRHPWPGPKKDVVVNKNHRIGWSKDIGHPWDKEKRECRKLKPNEEREYQTVNNKDK